MNGILAAHAICVSHSRMTGGQSREEALQESAERCIAGDMTAWHSRDQHNDTVCVHVLVWLPAWSEDMLSHCC